jgi:hypothetical protein
MKSFISKAASTVFLIELSAGTGNPPAAMYASPMVLIFSITSLQNKSLGLSELGSDQRKLAHRNGKGKYFKGEELEP